MLFDIHNKKTIGSLFLLTLLLLRLRKLSFIQKMFHLFGDQYKEVDH